MNEMVTCDQDFALWTKQQADLLRQGRWEEIDASNIAEELEDMGSSRERELESRLGVLLAHLLKWRHQPERRGKSWRATIKEQRQRIARLLAKNPSLKAQLAEAMTNGYSDGRLIAVRETPLDEQDFPPECPFTLEQTLDSDYWPE
jgi:ribosomal protein L29